MGFRDTLGELAGRQSAAVDDRAKSFVETGLRCFDEGRYQDAADNYTAAIQIEYNYVDPHHFLANTYGQMGQFADAFKEYGIALNLAQRFLPDTIRKRSIEHIMHNLSLTISAKRSSQGSYPDAAKDFKAICSTLKPPTLLPCHFGADLLPRSGPRQRSDPGVQEIPVERQGW